MLNRRSGLVAVIAATACFLMAAPGAMAGKQDSVNTNVSPQMTHAAMAKAKPKKAKTKTSFRITCLLCPRRTASERLGVPLEFSGKVKSKSGKCVEGRTVRIIQTTGNVQVNETTTMDDGTWATTTVGGFTEYRALVTKEKRGNVVCKRAKSKPKTASP